MKRLALLLALLPAVALAALITMSGGRGVPVPGGGGGDFLAPTWASSMTVGTWDEISTNTLRDVAPCPLDNCAYSTIIGTDCILGCWNGAIIATGYGNKGAYIAWGGGHNGYWGNEVYAFDFETLAWERLSEPNNQSTNCPGTGDGTNITSGLWNATSTPVVPHTYYNVFYHPPTNSLGSMRVERNACGGHELIRPVFFDLDTNEWSIAACCGSSNAYGGYTFYDPSRDLVVTEGGDTGAIWQEYLINGGSVTAGTYTNRTTKFGAINNFGVVDTNRDIVVIARVQYQCPLNDMYALDLDNRAGSATLLTVAGTEPNLCEGGFDFSPTADAFFFRPNQDTNGGSPLEEVYKFELTSGDPLTGTWTWSNVVHASNALAPPDPGPGKMGRFNIIEWDNGAGGKVIVATEANDVDGGFYAFRIQ